MDKLISQLARLYFLPEQPWREPGAEAGEGALTPALVADHLSGARRVALDLVSSAGLVRAMVVHFSKSADWEEVARLHQLVQEELELPAPAIAISGQTGFELWFSLAEPVTAAQAEAFLKALQQHYLADRPALRCEFLPAAATRATSLLVPSLEPLSGNWSAYIDPSLGSMFIDEPWLEMIPNLDKQASILAGLKSIKAADFARALTLLQTPAATPGEPESLPGEGGQPFSAPACRDSCLSVGSHYRDPQSFLLAVMNDPSASARQRIQAAKALLPYFAEQGKD